MTLIITPAEAYIQIKKGLAPDILKSNITTHFKWREVFTNCMLGEVRACPLITYENALKQALVMEQIREYFGQPIYVHSWFRSPKMNQLVGGAPNSYHLKGLATDFHINGYESEADNRKIQNILDKLPWMQPCGLEFTKGPWTHVDCRGFRTRFSRT